MDSYSSPVAFKHVFKVSEEELKSKFKSETGIVVDNVIEIASNGIEINGFPDLQCLISLQLEIEFHENGEKSEMIWVYLTLLNIDDNMEVFSKFVLYIKSANYLHYLNCLYTSADDESWGREVCTLTELFDPEKKYIVGGEFVLETKAILFLNSAKKQTEKPENSRIERLWNDEDERDFMIAVGKENEHKVEIKIHKCVLSVCSPVFKRMFKTDMKEKQEGKVEIIDFDSDTVESAVAFCYEQNIFEDFGELPQLIALHRFADKYDIEDLKDQTESHLVLELSLEDICGTTNAVINLNAPKLRDFCFRFLLMAVKEGIPVKDMDILDKDFAIDLLKKATSVENC